LAFLDDFLFGDLTFLDLRFGDLAFLDDFLFGDLAFLDDFLFGDLTFLDLRFGDLAFLDDFLFGDLTFLDDLRFKDRFLDLRFGDLLFLDLRFSDLRVLEIQRLFLVSFLPGGQTLPLIMLYTSPVRLRLRFPSTNCIRTGERFNLDLAACKASGVNDPPNKLETNFSIIILFYTISK
jgi:hypothetical protein